MSILSSIYENYKEVVVTAYGLTQIQTERGVTYRNNLDTVAIRNIIALGGIMSRLNLPLLEDYNNGETVVKMCNDHSSDVLALYHRLLFIYQLNNPLNSDTYALSDVIINGLYRARTQIITKSVVQDYYGVKATLPIEVDRTSNAPPLRFQTIKEVDDDKADELIDRRKVALIFNVLSHLYLDTINESLLGTSVYRKVTEGDKS